MNIEKPYCRIKNKQKWDIAPGHPMFCCQEWIDAWVNEDAVPISYHPAKRYYYVICDNRVVWVQRIRRCMVCNCEFPKDLFEEYVEILKNEYGLTDATFADKPAEEFKSEEWWRNRGL